MSTNTNAENLILDISRTVSDEEIENTKSTSEQVKKMYVQGDIKMVGKLVMVAHDVEGEVF